jgi:hypothetical protein
MKGNSTFQNRTGVSFAPVYHNNQPAGPNPAINAGSVRNPMNETPFVPPSAVSHASRQPVLRVVPSNWPN